MDPRVEAIRANEKLGRGTGSMIDSHWSDDDLIEGLNRCYARTPADALLWAAEIELAEVERPEDTGRYQSRYMDDCR